MIAAVDIEQVADTDPDIAAYAYRQAVRAVPIPRKVPVMTDAETRRKQAAGDRALLADWDQDQFFRDYMDFLTTMTRAYFDWMANSAKMLGFTAR